MDINVHCPKCFNKPCECGYEYKDLTTKELELLIAVLTKMKESKEK